MKVKLPKFECLRCGHKWSPRTDAKPLRCAFCKSPYWTKSVETPSLGQGKHDQECVDCRGKR